MSFTSTAWRFSSRWSRLLLLGMGMMSGPWAMSHASASWVVVMPLSLATSSTWASKLQVAFDVAGLEAGLVAAAVAFTKVVQAADGAGEEAAAQGRVGH